MLVRGAVGVGDGRVGAQDLRPGGVRGRGEIEHHFEIRTLGMRVRRMTGHVTSMLRTPPSAQKKSMGGGH